MGSKDMKSPFRKVMKQKYRLRGKIKTRGMVAMMDGDVNQILKQKNQSKPKIKENNLEVIGLKDMKSHINQEVIFSRDMKSPVRDMKSQVRDMKSPLRETKSPRNKVMKQNYRLRGKIKTRGMMALMDGILKQKNLNKPKIKETIREVTGSKDKKYLDQEVIGSKDIKSHINLEVIGLNDKRSHINQEVKVSRDMKSPVREIKSPSNKVMKQKYRLRGKIKTRGMMALMDVKDVKSHVNQILKKKNLFKNKNNNLKIRKDLKLKDCDPGNIRSLIDEAIEKKNYIEIEKELKILKKIQGVNGVKKNDLKKELELAIVESTLEVMGVKDQISQVNEANVQKNEKELKIEESSLIGMDVKETKSRIQEVNDQKKELELEKSTPRVMDVKDAKFQIEAVKEQKHEKELEMEERNHEMMGVKDSKSNIEKVNEQKNHLENEAIKMIEGTQGEVNVKDFESPTEIVIVPNDLLKNEKELKLKESTQEVIDVNDNNSQIEIVENEKELKLKESAQGMMEIKDIKSHIEKVNDQNNLFETEKEQKIIETPQINGHDNPLENENELKIWRTPQVNGQKNPLENEEEKKIIGSPHGLMGLKDIKLHLDNLVKQKSLLKRRRCLFKLDSSEIFDSAPPDETDYPIDNSIDNPHLKKRKRKIEVTFNPHIKQKYTKKKEEISNPFLEGKSAEKIEEEYFQEMQSKMKSNKHSLPSKIKSIKNSLKSRHCLYKYNVGDMYEGPPNEIIPLQYKLTESPHKIVKRQLEDKTNMNTKDL